MRIDVSPERLTARTPAPRSAFDPATMPCPALRPVVWMRPGPLIPGPRRGRDDSMPKHKLERMAADFALMLAKRRAEHRTPDTPAWDVALRDVEAMEREVVRLDQGTRESTKRPIGGL